MNRVLIIAALIAFVFGVFAFLLPTATWIAIGLALYTASHLVA